MFVGLHAHLLIKVMMKTLCIYAVPPVKQAILMCSQMKLVQAPALLHLLLGQKALLSSVIFPVTLTIVLSFTIQFLQHALQVVVILKEVKETINFVIYALQELTDMKMALVSRLAIH